MHFSKHELGYAAEMNDTKISVASQNNSLFLILQKSSALGLLVKIQHSTHLAYGISACTCTSQIQAIEQCI